LAAKLRRFPPPPGRGLGAHVEVFRPSRAAPSKGRELAQPFGPPPPPGGFAAGRSPRNGSGLDPFSSLALRPRSHSVAKCCAPRASTAATRSWLGARKYSAAAVRAREAAASASGSGQPRLRAVRWLPRLKKHGLQPTTLRRPLSDWRSQRSRHGMSLRERGYEPGRRRSAATGRPPAAGRARCPEAGRAPPPGPPPMSGPTPGGTIAPAGAAPHAHAPRFLAADQHLNPFEHTQAGDVF